MIFIVVILAIVVIKWIWVCCATRNQDSIEKEKKEIYERLDYLLSYGHFLI